MVSFAALLVHQQRKVVDAVMTIIETLTAIPHHGRRRCLVVSLVS
jgi:hypothetical protein